MSIFWKSSQKGSRFSPLPLNHYSFLMRLLLLFLFTLTLNLTLYSQHSTFSRQDTLRGSITPERAWWDLTYYHLTVKVSPEDSFLKGSNLVQYRVLESARRMQIDLQPPMRLTLAIQDGVPLHITHEGNAHYIKLIGDQAVGEVKEMLLHFEGRPPVSENPPWSGGLVWQKDKQGKHLVTTVCQGDGASLWWPCKDHLYDEPDSMLISVRVPDDLMDVSNGRLRHTQQHRDGTKTYDWFVANPISNYVVNMNIADYVHFGEVYPGEKGLLDCDYYVLRGNLEKAKRQFQDVPRMLKAFEHWFGPYPFYEDGYKLVEVPYYGMEHQSSVTYGNGFSNGYHGTDVSHTGWGFKFDFIIIHESGHEWFANNITCKDIADMWIHESFTAYSENLFLDYHYGKEASAEYVRGTRNNIKNDKPLIGPYHVNQPGSWDMYYKGENILHMLRQLLADDEQWRAILRGLNETFYHQTVTAAQIEGFIMEKSGKKLQPFFDQYLRDQRVPILEYAIQDSLLNFRWGNCITAFDMPLEVMINGKTHWLQPTTSWKQQAIEEPIKDFVIDPDYYVGGMDIMGK